MRRGNLAKLLGTVAVLGGIAAGAMFLPNLLRAVHEADIRDSQGTPDSTAANDSLSCGSDEAKALAIQVIGKNPPDTLLNNAGGKHFDGNLNPTVQSQIASCDDSFTKAKSSSCSFRAELCDALSSQARDDQSSCHQKANAAFDTWVRDAKSKAQYSIRYIRLESRDQATGAIICNANVQASLPSNLGTAETEISYKIEKMEDGGLHIDLAGLQ